ncbi:SMI1/KNR4 family protein [Streptomyces xanthophaeus]|uniref:SMI1/KNR4 family protein n=1 Tax=Streptomyces xanthophaeus TaxID=67385 RepID=UPI0036537088
MTKDLVQDSWSRIDAWLREHAPRTFATLGPPAGPEEIAAAEEELGVTFPPDLVASLLRHNGALDGEEAFRFSTHDRLLSVSEIVADTNQVHAQHRRGPGRGGSRTLLDRRLPQVRFLRGDV